MTGDQLRERIKKMGITQAEAAKRLNITERTLQNWFKLDQLDANTMVSIAKSLSTNSSDQTISALYSVNQDQRGRPYYDVDFINGYDLIINDQTTNPAHYIDFPQYNNADYWANATGNSMAPLINHGDIVALKQLHDWSTYLLYGEVYAIVTDEYRTIKKVRKSTKGDTHVRFVPLNTEEFDEQDIAKDTIRVVYQVIGCAKKIF